MRIAVFLILLALLCSPASALELSIADAVHRGIEANAGFKSYQAAVDASTEGVNIARTMLMPSLSLRGSYAYKDEEDAFRGKAYVPGFQPSDLYLPFGNRETYGMTFYVEQPIFWGGQLLHKYAKSQIALEQTRHIQSRQKRLLVFDIKKAYFNALKEQIQEGTLQRVIALQAERLRIARELSREGYMTEEDVMAAETELAVQELNQFKTLNKKEHALSTLRRLIHIGEDEPLSLTSMPGNLHLAAAREELREKALASREDLKIADGNIRISDKELRMAEGDFLPKTWLQGQYTFQKETAMTRPETWTVSAQLEWSLFEWGRTRSEVRRAKALKQKSQYDYEDLVRSVSAEADDAWRSCKEKEKEVAYQEKRLRTTEHRYRKAIDKFSEKKTRIADLLEAETDFFKSYADYLAAIVDLNIQIFHVEAMISAFDENWIIVKDQYKPDIAGLSDRTTEAFSALESDLQRYREQQKAVR